MQENFWKTVGAIERHRCEATLGDDWATLERILSDDIAFIHSTGYVHDKAGYLDFLKNRIKTLQISRPAPPVCKIMSGGILVFGPIDQQMERRADASIVKVSSWTTQLWSPFESAWKLTHQHSTRRA
jgi:hypothetical protein